MLVIHSRQSNLIHFMAVLVARVSTVTDMPLNEIFFIFFDSYLRKSKDFVGHKVTSNSHVDSWHPTLGAKSSRVAPLSVWNLNLVIVLTLEVCSANPWGAVRQSDKRQIDSVCLTTHGSHFLEEICSSTDLWYLDDLLHSCQWREQRTFYASVCVVGIARLACCCLSGAPFDLWSDSFC